MPVPADVVIDADVRARRTVDPGAAPGRLGERRQEAGRGPAELATRRRPVPGDGEGPAAGSARAEALAMLLGSTLTASELALRLARPQDAAPAASRDVLLAREQLARARDPAARLPAAPEPPSAVTGRTDAASLGRAAQAALAQYTRLVPEDAGGRRLAPAAVSLEV